MTEPDVYLEKLSAFSRMLHLENLSVSPKETEDAARLLIALPPSAFCHQASSFSWNFAENRSKSAKIIMEIAEE